jgi:hypothetical protein
MVVQLLSVFIPLVYFRFVEAARGGPSTGQYRRNGCGFGADPTGLGMGEIWGARTNTAERTAPVISSPTQTHITVRNAGSSTAGSV